MVISFDFDLTLSEYSMQVLARKFIKAGIDVWVITLRREGNHNKDLFEVIGKCGIPIQKVIFTSNEEKYKFVEVISADLHIDNSKNQCEEINSYKSFCSLFYSNI